VCGMALSVPYRVERHPASLMSFVPNVAGLEFLFTNPTGGIADELSAQGDRLVAVSRDYLGTQWPGGPSSPPQPFRRSGDLQASIRATEPRVVDSVLQVQLVADATHRGWAYPFVLRERGFQFIDLDVLS